MSDPRLSVGVKLLREGARLPARAYEGGVALDLPPSAAALTLPRSGLAARHGISLVNAPGLIDPGYRGELRLVVLNTDPAQPFTVRRGERIAQLLIVALAPVVLHEVAELSPADRGERGFGSSGF
jgi:dUTP pyrophosphatase